MVKNVHERLICASLEKVGGLIDRLASRDDALWPRDRWPPMRFDRPLGTGAIGGHGPIRYFVEAYERGRSIHFRFTAPRGFVGTHRLDVEEVATNVVRFRHVLEMRPEGAARLSWPFVFRPLHNALIEDALDCAEAYCASKIVEKREWSLWVRVLRSLLATLQERQHSKVESQQTATETDKTSNTKSALQETLRGN
jgi:hypothetical protein